MPGVKGKKTVFPGVSGALEENFQQFSGKSRSSVKYEHMQVLTSVYVGTSN